MFLTLQKVEVQQLQGVAQIHVFEIALQFDKPSGCQGGCSECENAHSQRLIFADQD